MKTYKITYWNKIKNKPKSLVEIRSGVLYGTEILFLITGDKFTQFKRKNNLLNGVYKDFDYKLLFNNLNKTLIQPLSFGNLKKDNSQGIEISFF